MIDKLKCKWKGFVAEVLVGAFIFWSSGHECGDVQVFVADGFAGIQEEFIWFLEVCNQLGLASSRALVGKRWSSSDRSLGSEKDWESSNFHVL